MKPKTSRVIAITLLVCSAAAASYFVAAASAARRAAKPDIQRGDYLINKVALCADCHSPRNEKGEFIREAWLMGAPVDFQPSAPIPNWAPVALPIAGLPTFATDEDAVRFLMTGKKADGQVARPPMPHFQFNRKDAEDAVAYLRSLAKTS